MLKIAFLVNAPPGSPLHRRARRFSELLDERYRCSLLARTGGRGMAAIRMLVHLMRQGPRIVYVVDLAASGVIAGSVYKLMTGSRLAIETGDDIYALARSLGRRGALGLMLTAALELWALHYADFVVARGFEHLIVLREQGVGESAWLPDGVDVDQFQVDEDPVLRSAWAPGGELVVGALGSMAWNEQTGTCYGWDLVAALGLLKDRPIRGVIIGDGTGRAFLEQHCGELEVRDRVVFAGAIDYDELPRYLASLDVCLSTQTNDPVGRVRTTGKLPLYMAAGRFVLASRVGEAARTLPEGMLLEFRGSHDPLYPTRLAARLDQLLQHRERLALGGINRDIARERFDYRALAPRLQKMLDQLMGSGQG